jgi:hypothetical protein
MALTENCPRRELLAQPSELGHYSLLYSVMWAKRGQWIINDNNNKLKEEEEEEEVERGA